MSNYRRPQNEGGLYFFTVVTQHRRPVLTQAQTRQLLRQAIIEVRRRFPFCIHAWILLPDHIHCIWELPEGDADFGKRWALIKAGVSKGVQAVPAVNDSQARRRERGFWQRRFWEHRIRDEEDYRKHMDYLHWNPMKHGLVTRVSDWPSSSFHRLVREGIYPADWGIADDIEGAFGE